MAPSSKWSCSVLLLWILDIYDDGHLLHCFGNFLFHLLLFDPTCFFSIFAFSYFTEKRKLLNGVLFNFFLISFGGYLVTLLLETQNIFIGGLFAIIAIPVLLILLFGVYILIVFLFWNGLLVLKRESRSLANLLTLLLAIFLTLYTIFQIFFIQYFPQWFNVLFTAVPLILFYLFVVFYNFITVSFLY